ncbi:MAG TPA: DUF1365 domain-containing protein [Gaiellales bacterium]|nr:DUF1365 domain-containing protein [Gaiellales bacterium]
MTDGTGAALYEGQVMHTRPRAGDATAPYLFRYGVYMWLVDLDRLPRLPLPLRPLGRIRSRDHLGDPARSIRQNVDAFLAGHGIDLAGGRVLMLANARAFGHVFNPLSVHWCYGAGGDLRCIVAEVHNTYGERHCYLLEPGDRGRAETGKEFYVSPFLSVDGSYRMAFSAPGDRLSIQMELIQGGRRVFQASLTGRRRPLTAGMLLRMAGRYPFMTARVSALIRYHGIRLWLRRVPRVPRPARTPQRWVG